MSDQNGIDPRTPVLIGVGQYNDQLGSEGYRALSAVDLAGEAAKAALADTGADAAAVAAAVDTAAGIRQFETSTPGAPAPLGKSDNYPRSVAGRVGADPAHAILEVGGGQGPQHLISEISGKIAHGDADVALVFGSEAISTVRAHAKLAKDDPQRPDFREKVGGQLEDRGFGLAGLMSMEAVNHGLTGAPAQYALFENARRAKRGTTRAQNATEMGELFAPFTEVAAANPYSAAPTARSAADLATVTEKNRMIADPYPRYMVARDQVNQGAAVIIASVASARELGVPEEKWVYIHGHADARERDLMDRQDFAESPAARMATDAALDQAGVTPDQIATWDFYSCFPIPVENVALDHLGLSVDDPRGLTLTGGLPFFGGAGNNYSMHAVAETVDRARKTPGSYGFVGANGGLLSKYSAAVYSTTPTGWKEDTSAAIQEEINSWPSVPQTSRPEGPATIETFTIQYDREGNPTVSTVIGRLGETGERFIAMGLPKDAEILALLQSEDPIGEQVYVTATAKGNYVTTSRERLLELRPPQAPALRESYEYLNVEVEDHLLTVTINRPEARNSLFPPAHEELDSVFDYFFATKELWVAIITGAGDKAFCSGNDLKYSASGKPNYVPLNGFGGLTSRRNMNKPVIAAVNGFAMGGGFEISLASHLVVADETAQFALSEVNVGLIAGAGGVVRLPRQIPEKKAYELILTGRKMDVHEAESLGVVSRIAPAGQALAEAKKLAADIMSGSPTSVRISLEVMEQTRVIPDVIDAVTLRSDAFDELMTSSDAIEGMTAFAQKRAPQWKNQ